MAEMANIRRKLPKSTLRTPLRRVVLLALPPVQALDVLGPASVFTTANRYRASGAYYDVFVATTAQSLVVASDTGIPLIAAGKMSSVRSADTVLVAGGEGARGPIEPSVVRWLRTMQPSTRRFGAVCTGAFALAQAGLLDGRRATTHWAFIDEFRRRFPQVRVDSDAIWVHDDLYSSAGISAGVDLALALVEADLGNEVALAVARHLVLFLRRPGGQSQFSATLSAQHTEHTAFAELAVWVAENLRGDLSVSALAEHTAMSDRHFARRFQKEVGLSPAKYVARTRLDVARRLLETSDMPVSDVAAACGFKSDDAFRRAFVASICVAPTEYRKRFAARHFVA